MDWKTVDNEYAKDFAARVDAITPEPLFESSVLPSPKVCLICAGGLAHSGLYSGIRLIVPMCKACASDWNLYGYEVLKRVRPKELLFRLAQYKAFHLLRRPGVIEIFKDVQEMSTWAKKMRTILKASRDMA